MYQEYLPSHTTCVCQQKHRVLHLATYSIKEDLAATLATLASASALAAASAAHLATTGDSPASSPEVPLLIVPAAAAPAT